MTTVVRIAVSTSPDRALGVRKYVQGEPTENQLLRDGDEAELTCFPGQTYQFDEVNVEAEAPTVAKYDPANDVDPLAVRSAAEAAAEDEDDEGVDPFYAVDGTTGEVFDPSADAPQSVQDGTADDDPEFEIELEKLVETSAQEALDETLAELAGEDENKADEEAV